MAKDYTHKLHHMTPKKGLHVPNSSSKTGPSASYGQVSEGLRRKELLYDIANLVPNGWSKRGSQGFRLPILRNSERALETYSV